MCATMCTSVLACPRFDRWHGGYTVITHTLHVGGHTMKYMLESGRIVEATIEEYRGIDIPKHMEDDEKQNVDSIIENLLGEIGFVYSGETGNDIIGLIGEVNEIVEDAINDLHLFDCHIDKTPEMWIATNGNTDSTLDDLDLEIATDDDVDNPWLYLGLSGCYARPFNGIAVCGAVAHDLKTRFENLQ